MTRIQTSGLGGASSGGGGATPGGNNTDIQYNASGSFGGSDNLTWDDPYLTALNLKVTDYISDVSNVNFIDTNNRDIYDETGVLAFSFQSSAGPNFRSAFDYSGNQSIDYANGYLVDVTGNLVTCAWRLYQLFDSNFGTASIDWNARHLISSDGSLVQLDWTNPNGLTINSAVQNYNGETTQHNGLISIPAYVDLPGQTSSINSTALLTVPASGLYEVNIYQNTTTTGSAGTMHSFLSWTDSSGLRSESPASDLLLTTNGYSHGKIVIYCTATTQILYQTTVTGAVGSPQYQICISVSRLA